MLKYASILAAFALAAACQARQTGMTKGPAAGPDRQAVVARVDGQTITAGELDDGIKGGLVRADVEYREKVHELRSDGLDKLIDDRLVARAAKTAGVTSDALLEREVYAKLGEPTESDLHQVYDQAKQAGQDLPPFEAVHDQIVRYVKDQRREEAVSGYHQKLRGSTKVENLLPPIDLPRVAVDAVGATQGAADAPVTIVAFSDYECPFCKKAEPAVKSVIEAYKGKVRLVYREFPLPMHRHAEKASEAALCAGDQGKYWEMHEKLFDNQQALEVTDLKGYARAVGLDGGRFDTCLDGNQKRKEIAAAIKAGEEAGVSGTPAFFINGQPLFGALPFERFKEVIDRELASGKL